MTFRHYTLEADGGRVFAAILLLVAAPLAHGRECTRNEAMAAEKVAAKISNWLDVYGASRRYGHCADGAIAEGFTESVVHLLATKWESLPEVAALAEKHHRFRRFVLRHVN